MSAFKRLVEQEIKDAKMAEKHIGRTLSQLWAEGIITMVEVDGETKFVMATNHSYEPREKP